jgi:hypothetical protein
MLYKLWGPLRNSIELMFIYLYPSLGTTMPHWTELQSSDRLLYVLHLIWELNFYVIMRWTWGSCDLIQVGIIIGWGISVDRSTTIVPWQL